MITPKIIELLIEEGDMEAGLDGIALVEMPAHESTFEFFSDIEEEPCNGNCSHYVLSDEKIPEILQMFNAFGEPQGFLEQEGWYIDSIKQMGRQDFQLLADPNAPSAQDTPDVRFRYKYVGPKDTKNRTFCAEMMSANRVFRIEDIDEMSLRSVNSVGPDGYDIFTWRGSYNCRHRWVQLIYRRQGTIINKSTVRKGLIDEDGMPGPDTRTEATIAAGNTPPRTGFNQSNPDVSALSPYVEQISKPKKKPVLQSIPMFENKEDAEALALLMGCEGSHSMKVGDKELWMPCKEHFEDDLENACWEGYEPVGLKEKDGRLVPNCVPVDMKEEQFESYNDYPKSAKENACKVLKWRDEYGDEVKGMTQVGWVRANQLCKGENISEETIARMSSFQRHRQNAEISDEYKGTPWKDAGYVAWLGWGGTEGIEWASRKLENIREDMSAHTELGFSIFNNEQRLVVGPAMIPDKMIIRRNEITGEIYYVYFTADTIKKLQQKFMQDRLLNKTNIEHSSRFLNGVDVVESWIVDDEVYDKQKVFGMDYPKGTWMIIMKVEDDVTWNKVKDGQLKGFSVQGFFLEKAKFSTHNSDVVEEIKKILKQVK